MNTILEMAKQALNDDKFERANCLALIALVEALDKEPDSESFSLSLEPLDPLVPDLQEAAQCLVDVLNDEIIKWGRPGIGYVNTEAIIYWRDKVYECLVSV